MSKTKHTPGPWKYEASTKTIRSVPANYWLATMNSFDGAVNNEANARLIALAPKMLDALQIAYACLRRPDSERDENYVVNLLNSIIAEAEGRP